MPGLAVGYQVRDLQTGQILFRQVVVWHPDPNKDIGVRSPCAIPGVKYRRYVPRHAGIIGFTSRYDYLEVVLERLEGEALESDGGGAEP